MLIEKSLILKAICLLMLLLLSFLLSHCTLCQVKFMVNFVHLVLHKMFAGLISEVASRISKIDETVWKNSGLVGWCSHYNKLVLFIFSYVFMQKQPSCKKSVTICVHLLAVIFNFTTFFTQHFKGRTFLTAWQSFHGFHFFFYGIKGHIMQIFIWVRVSLFTFLHSILTTKIIFTFIFYL